VSTSLKLNLMHGIAVYADPDLEIRKREHVARQVERCPREKVIDRVDMLVGHFGRETVRAVVGEDLC
jgi:hypothetical protein